jgi:6-phosphofructo-2-kinase
MDTLEELLHWLMEENGSVGILGGCHDSLCSFVDATNSTRERRKMILECVRQIEDLNVLFIESICTDKKVLRCHALLRVDTGKQYATQAERARL